MTTNKDNSRNDLTRRKTLKRLGATATGAAVYPSKSVGDNDYQRVTETDLVEVALVNKPISEEIPPSNIVRHDKYADYIINNNGDILVEDRSENGILDKFTQNRSLIRTPHKYSNYKNNTLEGVQESDITNQKQNRKSIPTKIGVDNSLSEELIIQSDYDIPAVNIRNNGFNQKAFLETPEGEIEVPTGKSSSIELDSKSVIIDKPTNRVQEFYDGRINIKNTVRQYEETTIKIKPIIRIRNWGALSVKSVSNGADQS